MRIEDIIRKKGCGTVVVSCSICPVSHICERERATPKNHRFPDCAGCKYEGIEGPRCEMCSPGHTDDMYVPSKL